VRPARSTGLLASESREQGRGLTGGNSLAVRSPAKPLAPLCFPRSPAHDPALDLLSTGLEHGWWRAWRLGGACGGASHRRLLLDLNCPLGEHPCTSPNLTHTLEEREGGQRQSGHVRVADTAAMVLSVAIIDPGSSPTANVRLSWVKRLEAEM
jgi:hypothetical protein